MIIKLDHYRKSKTRALVDSFYSQQQTVDTAPQREPAQILYAAWHSATQPSTDRDGIATPDKS